MSLHLGAKSGDIASTVLITGDPLRAKHYAEHFLDNPLCYNKIRGMLGYTGTYRGIPVSIQGTGIGIPSTALYIHELTHSYEVNCIIRIGTCGALQANLVLGDLVAGQRQCIMHGQNTLNFPGGLAGARHGLAEESQQEQHA